MKLSSRRIWMVIIALIMLRFVQAMFLSKEPQTTQYEQVIHDPH